MSQVIGTNLASLNAQRNLAGSQRSLTTSLQRLSSGLRINSARDDAAGMASAERMTAQIRGMERAQRNASDGISLLQTADGAVGEIVNNLQRIRELAVQAANGSYSDGDRISLDSEVQQRIAQVTQVAEQTTFNGRRLLDGSFGVGSLLVGANTDDLIELRLNQGLKATQIGQQVMDSSHVEVSSANLSGSGTIAIGVSPAVTIAPAVAGLQPGQTASSAYAKAVAIGNAALAGLEVSASNTLEFDISPTGGALNNAYSLRINGVWIYQDAAVETPLTQQNIVDAINSHAAQSGVSATLDGSVLRLSSGDGRDIAIGQQLDGGASGAIAAQTDGETIVNGVSYRDGRMGAVLDATANSVVPSVVNRGTISLSSCSEIHITGDGTALGFPLNDYTISLDAVSLATQHVRTTDRPRWYGDVCGESAAWCVWSHDEPFGCHASDPPNECGKSERNAWPHR